MQFIRGESFLQAMEWSALAYKEVQPKVLGTCLTEVEDRELDVQCFVRRRGKDLAITFRGSNSARDWITNLTFWKKSIPYDGVNSEIRVHTGFLNAYKKKDIRLQLQKLMGSSPEVERVILSGHSNGAAMAVLCAVDLQYHFPDKSFAVFLFGCPRVGNRAFQKSYDKRVFLTFRVENGNDIVTKIPPALWGYRHVGMRIPIGRRRVFGVVSLSQHRQPAYYQSLVRRFL